MPKLPGQSIVGFKGDECQCGRRESVRHCPQCGSTRLYAPKSRQWKEHSDGTFTKEQTYNCYACNHFFIDKEREFCAAPPISKALALQRIKAIKGEQAIKNEGDKIVDALVTILSPAAQNDHKKAHDLLIYNLRIEYADKKAAGESIDVIGTMDEYVVRRLKELGAPDRSVSTGTVVGEKTQSTSADRAQTTLSERPEPVVETTVPERTHLKVSDFGDTNFEDDRTVPAEERSIRLEWGRKKLAGQKVPPIDEYVARRLAGEIFGEEGEL